MVAFYVRRIKTGKTTLSKVPTRWRDDVLAELDALLESGEITQEEYNQFIL